MSRGAADRHRPAEDAEREFRMLVDGAWVAAESGETFSCVDPFTEKSWGRVPLAGAATSTAPFAPPAGRSTTAAGQRRPRLSAPRCCAGSPP